MFVKHEKRTNNSMLMRTSAMLKRGLNVALSIRTLGNYCSPIFAFASVAARVQTTFLDSPQPKIMPCMVKILLQKFLCEVDFRSLWLEMFHFAF